MIEESYVSFDTAKMLKEAGFDEVCNLFYVSGKGDTCLMYERNSRLDKGQYSCPTQALAARWLRETHGFHVFAKRAYDYILSRHTWGFWIQREKYDTALSLEIGFDSYETALEAGLQEAIKLIKK